MQLGYLTLIRNTRVFHVILKDHMTCISSHHVTTQFNTLYWENFLTAFTWQFLYCKYQNCGNITSFHNFSWSSVLGTVWIIFLWCNEYNMSSFYKMYFIILWYSSLGYGISLHPSPNPYPPLPTYDYTSTVIWTMCIKIKYSESPTIFS